MIAQAILEQLGMRNLKLMVGAYNFLDLGEGVSFRFKGSRRLNHCKILLNANDLYDVSFCQVGTTGKIKNVEMHEDIYVDMLHELFESATGLTLHVPKIVGLNG